MRVGETVYDEDGCEYTLLHIELSGVGYVVSPILADYSGEVYDGDPIVLKRVYESAVTHRVHSEIESYRNELSEVRKELSAANAELREMSKGRDKIISRLSSEVEALKRIEDFIDGKITHYVVHQYSDWKIVPFRDGPSSKSSSLVEDARAYGQKLLSLFGSSNGNLSWRINGYSDGSGCYYECIPCLSQEEAVSVLSEKVSPVIKEIMDRPWMQRDFRALDKYAALFREHGIPVGAEVEDAIACWKKAVKESAVAAAKKALAEAEATEVA